MKLKEEMEKRKHEAMLNEEEEWSFIEERVFDMFMNEGASPALIAEIVGIGILSVNKILKKHEGEIRNGH